MDSADFPTTDRAILNERKLTPMAAVDALYSESGEFAEAIVASLSEQIFGELEHLPNKGVRNLLSVATFRLLKRTTRTHSTSDADGREMTTYRNRILERSGHPYAHTLLKPSEALSATFVEGGDPMNAPYMMISPEIRAIAGRWDRILLGSMLGRDVQLRFIWEARATIAAARERLARGESVRLKAAAAGTGLNLILVFDRLLREGFDPAMIHATITDRDPGNVTKCTRLLGHLATTRKHLVDAGKPAGIRAQIEDLMEPELKAGDHSHVVTLIGILEYFRGFTCATMEENRREGLSGEESEAAQLVEKVAETMADGGTLIANTYRTKLGGRILEIFGKRLRYREPANLHELMVTAGLKPVGNAGSGNVYDVEVFEKT